MSMNQMCQTKAMTAYQMALNTLPDDFLGVKSTADIAEEFVRGNEHRALASLVILYIYEAIQMYQSQFRINSMILGGELQ